MDSILADFLADSGFGSGVEGGRMRRMNGKRKGGRMEGVWVRCRGSDIRVDGDDKAGGGRHEGEGDGECGEDDQEEDEEDEMIWWSWDGKIVGFSDW